MTSISPFYHSTNGYTQSRWKSKTERAEKKAFSAEYETQRTQRSQRRASLPLSCPRSPRPLRLDFLHYRLAVERSGAMCPRMIRAAKTSSAVLLLIFCPLGTKSRAQKPAP